MNLIILNNSALFLKAHSRAVGGKNNRLFLKVILPTYTDCMVSDRDNRQMPEIRLHTSHLKGQNFVWQKIEIKS